jgi:hypothetical protein
MGVAGGNSSAARRVAVQRGLTKLIYFQELSQKEQSQIEVRGPPE